MCSESSTNSDQSSTWGQSVPDVVGYSTLASLCLSTGDCISASVTIMTSLHWLSSVSFVDRKNCPLGEFLNCWKTLKWQLSAPLLNRLTSDRCVVMVKRSWLTDWEEKNRAAVSSTLLWEGHSGSTGSSLCPQQIILQLCRLSSCGWTTFYWDRHSFRSWFLRMSGVAY